MSTRKRSIRTWVSLALIPALAAVLISPASTVRAADPTTVINLDASISTGSISPYIYGANHIWRDNGFYTWDPVNMKIIDNFDAAFKQSGIKIVRYPGGTLGNTFRWKNAIGPVSSRSEYYNGPQIPYYGVDEALTYMTSNNVQTLYVYDWANGNAQDAADLVEYVNAPNDGSNPNGGVDWAAVRAQNGHPDPYNVKFFEIGNEVPYPGQRYWTDGTPIDPATGQPMTNYSQDDIRHVLYAHGGTVAFTKQAVVNYTDTSDDPTTDQTDSSGGTANLMKKIQYAPVLPGKTTVYVGSDAWTEVSDLSQAGPQDHVYTLDDTSGIITFGDGVHGSIPPQDQKITVSYQSYHDGFDQYYAAMKAVDPTIKIYAADYNPLFMQTMGSTHPYDGIDRHTYTGNAPTKLNYVQYHDYVMNDLDTQNLAIFYTQRNMNAAAGPAAANKSVIDTEYGIISAKNSPEGNKYAASLDGALYLASTIMNRMDTHTPIAMRHLLTSPDIYDGIYTIYPDNTVVATPVAKVYQMFDQMFGDETIQSSITGNPDHVYTDINGKQQSYAALQYVTSRDSSGNVYLGVANRDEAADITTSINIGHHAPSGMAEVWSLDSANYWDYNDITNPNRVTIQTSSMAASSAFSYTFPAHSLTFIKIPGKILPNVNQQMALHYSLDEQSGTIASDSSGNGLNGTLVNGPAWTADGAIGGALSFDGNDDSVVTPPVLNPGTTSSFSVSSWVYRNAASQGSSEVILQQQNGGGSWLYVDSKTGLLKTHLGGSLSSQSSITPLEIGQWYQVGLVVDNGVGKLYVNGKLEATGTVSPGSHTDGLRIGSNAGNSNEHAQNPGTGTGEWNGKIDDVRMYKRALSDSDMQELAGQK